MDYADIKFEEKYAGNFVAFSNKTAEVYAYSKSIGDCFNKNGELKEEGLSTLCKKKGVNDYIIHKFEKSPEKISDKIL